VTTSETVSTTLSTTENSTTEKIITTENTPETSTDAPPTGDDAAVLPILITMLAAVLVEGAILLKTKKDEE
jgi:hypothetical protein